MKPRCLLVLGSIFLLTILATTRAHAQANLLFSGGNGTLTMTLSMAVEYQVTNYPMFDGTPVFVIGGTGDFANGSQYGVSGNITFSVDGGAPQAISILASGFESVYSLQPEDGYFYGDMPSVTVGDTVVLSAGTLTVTRPFTGTVPASGAYVTYLADGYGYEISGGGVAVPEPSTWALLGVGAGLLALTLGQRRARAAFATGQQ